MKTQEINKLGKELELYTFVDYVGKGFPIILPRGARLIRLLRNYVEQQEENEGYKVVRTPSLSNDEIYRIEDKYDFEKDTMFIINKEEKKDSTIVLKPYSEPFHCTIFNNKRRTYKELPLKLCETSTVFRNERDLKGLTKTRQFTLSDASVFCDRKKLRDSVEESLKLQKNIIDKLGLSEVTFEVATWDDSNKEDYIGTIEEWNMATKALEEALDKIGIKYSISKKARIFGPAIRIKYENSDFSSLQIDFEITHRFNLKFVNNENQEEFPIYIHNTIIGSYENLLSILLEKYHGKFPISFAPEQICIIPDREEYDEYAKKITQELKENNIRVKCNLANKTREQKINENTKLQIPIIATAGKDEMNEEKIKILTNEYIDEKTYEIKDFIKEVLNCQIQF